MLQMFAHPAEFNFPQHHPRRQQQQQQQQQQQLQQQRLAQGSSSPLYSSPSSSPSTFHSSATCKKRPLCFEPEFLAALDSSLTEPSGSASAASSMAAEELTSTHVPSSAAAPRPIKKVKKNGKTMTPLQQTSIGLSDHGHEPPLSFTSRHTTSAADAPTTAPNEAPYARHGSSPLPSRFVSSPSMGGNPSSRGSGNIVNHSDNNTTRPVTILPSQSSKLSGKIISNGAPLVSGDGVSNNSAVTGSTFSHSRSSPSHRKTRAGPSVIDLSSGEELVSLHLGENEHKRRRDSTCSISDNSFVSGNGGLPAESLREVFDVQDDGTLLPVWDHAPALPSQKKKVKLDGDAASPLRSIDIDGQEHTGNNERADDNIDENVNDLGRDSTVFGSLAGGFFRRFSSTASTNHGSKPSLDSSDTFTRHVDMGPYRDTAIHHRRHDWRRHRSGRSRYDPAQDDWLGDDETPEYDDFCNKTNSGSKKMDDRWALVKHQGTRVSLVPGVDELLKPHPTSCLSSNNDTQSSSAHRSQQQLVLYRRPALQAYAPANVTELKDDEDEHNPSGGAIIEELGDEVDDGALADDEHPSPRGARIHELDTDDDLEMEDDIDHPVPFNKNTRTGTDSSVLGIEEQIMGMDLD